jgi:hypothetical protein
MQAWVEEELRTSDFGDVRLDERFRLLMDELSQKPSVTRRLDYRHARRRD